MELYKKSGTQNKVHILLLTECSGAIREDILRRELHS